jgi:hypothetical protein
MAADEPPLRLRLLHAALASRLDEVRARIRPPLPTPDVVPHAPEDAEERLRVVMVRLWPRVAEGTATNDDLALLREHLHAVSRLSRTDDLRFFDAWNNVYEALGAEMDDALLSEYAGVLEAQMRRLTSR